MNEITGGSCTLEGAKVLAEVANIASTGGNQQFVVAQMDTNIGDGTMATSFVGCTFEIESDLFEDVTDASIDTLGEVLTSGFVRAYTIIFPEDIEELPYLEPLEISYDEQHKWIKFTTPVEEGVYNRTIKEQDFSVGSYISFSGMHNGKLSARLNIQAPQGE